MKCTKSFAAILTVALTTGINVAAMAAPINVENIKEDRIEKTENKKSDQNIKPSQQGSQGGKCSSFPWC